MKQCNFEYWILLLIVELKICRKNGDSEIYKFRRQFNDVFSVFMEFLPIKTCLDFFNLSACAEWTKNHQLKKCSAGVYWELLWGAVAVPGWSRVLLLPAPREGWDSPGQPWQHCWSLLWNPQPHMAAVECWHLLSPGNGKLIPRWLNFIR